MSIDTLGRHIRGEQEPSISRLRSIAEAMGITAQEILDRADQTIGRVKQRAEVAQQNSGRRERPDRRKRRGQRDGRS